MKRLNALILMKGGLHCEGYQPEKNSSSYDNFICAGDCHTTNWLDNVCTKLGCIWNKSYEMAFVLCGCSSTSLGMFMVIHDHDNLQTSKRHLNKVSLFVFRSIYFANPIMFVYFALSGLLNSSLTACSRFFPLQLNFIDGYNSMCLQLF